MRVWVLVFLMILGTGAGQASEPEAVVSDESPVSAPFNPQDPYESFNRKMFAFNMAVHESLGRPVASAYNALPSPVRTGVHNFFTNLGVPLTVIHDALQGKGEKAATDFMRFAINTVFGLGGLLDIATEAGMEYQPEDLGQTLYVWGVWDEASYLMLPLLGPYTTREAFGRSVDAVGDPAYTAILDARGDVQLAWRTLNGLDTYARVQPMLEQLESQPDPYIFVRESYLQYRMNLLYDGQPPVADIDDIDLE